MIKFKYEKKKEDLHYYEKDMHLFNDTNSLINRDYQC